MNLLNESLDLESELYDLWYCANEAEILIELAETGADREMDFDLEAEFDKRYEAYLASLQA